MADGAPEATELPWLQRECAQLAQAREQGHLPQALLIHDPGGLGGEALAHYAAQLALCRTPGGPCGRCRDCRWLAAGQHPDLFELAPEQDARVIRVEQVRALCHQLALTAHGGAATVAIIRPAEAMNANAANALLKALEEPRAGVSFLLISGAPSRLPATIVSRCQRLTLRAPARADSVAWLERRRGAADWSAVLEVIGEAPVRALSLDPAQLGQLRRQMSEELTAAAAGRLDVAAACERWARAGDYELRIACLERWLTARIEQAARASGRAPEMRNSAHLPSSTSGANIVILLRVLDGVYELRRLQQSSINRALALERLLWQLPRAWGMTAAAQPV